MTAIDTNVLVYLLDNSNTPKHKICKVIVIDDPLVCVQVVSEFLNVTKRLLKIPKEEILFKCREWLSFTTIQSIDLHTLDLASKLIKKYNFQLFDAIIAASALEAGCDILYSEDMQHGQLIENQLKIENPFL